MVAGDEELDCAEILITIKLKFSRRKMKITFLARISLDCENEPKGREIIEHMIQYQSLFSKSKSINIEIVKSFPGDWKPNEEKSLVQKMNEQLAEKGEVK